MVRVRLVERDFLAHNGARLGLTKRTIAQARLDEVHNPARGPNHCTLAANASSMLWG